MLIKDKNHAISIIESLYPADSEFLETSEIGKKLLQQAKNEVEGWRLESEAVLKRYAELCIIGDKHI